MSKLMRNFASTKTEEENVKVEENGFDDYIEEDEDEIRTMQT